MKSDLKIKIQADKCCEEEYVIKDNNGIIVGRFNINELNVSNKRCNIQLSFYKEKDYELIYDTLSLVLSTVFKNSKVFKINIQVLENINIDAFLNLGFTLEGVLSQNEYYKGEYLDDLSFGITRIEYSKNQNKPMIELKGKNIILRSLSPGYAYDIFKYYNKNKDYLAPFEPLRDYDFYTLETQRSLLNESYRQMLNGTTIELGIFKNNKFIGKIKLSNIVLGSLKSGVLGYSIDKDEQGNGYMKESVNVLLNYVFKECNLHRVEASALIDNIKSRKVLESIGFKLVGINEKYFLINGEWRDHATYYITKEDFYK